MACRKAIHPSLLLLTALISVLAATNLHGEQGYRDVREAVKKPPVDIDSPPPTDSDTTGTAVGEPTAADDAKAAAELKRRAGERIADDPRGRAVVLGMYLQEVDRGRVKVVEVGAASPAFDAGIREGDDLLSYHGFSAKTYRKWIDGIKKLTTDAPEGATIPVVVSRDGKRMSLHIRVPERKADDPRLPTALGQRIEEQTQVVPGPGTTTAPFPVPGGRGGDDVFIGNTGPFGDFFGGQAGGTNERAMAEIFRLNAPQPPQSKRVDRLKAANDASGQAANGSARIGLAGFRNDVNGMLVMVDVGGLEPGNYTVGISEPGLVGGPSGTDAATPQGAGPTPQAAPNGITPDGTRVPRKPEPILVPPGGAQPQSRIEGGQPQSRVLAQVTDPAPATPVPVDPNTTPPDIGDPSLNTTVPPTNQAAGGVSTLNEIGVLTVDESGTGRMQQVVEGVLVRDVVGQAIVIYSQSGPPQTTLPPNLDPSADAAAGQAANNPNQSEIAPKVSDPNRNAAVVTPQVARQPTTGQQPLASGQTFGSKAPVAAGVIRLISDRRPGTTGLDDQGTQPAADPVSGPPAGIPPVSAQDSLK